MRRTATRDVELHGKTIKAGEKVVMWFCSGNRDERVFKDPDRFLYDRSPNDHIGFGWGVHACLGAHLARVEARVFSAPDRARAARRRPRGARSGCRATSSAASSAFPSGW